MRPHTGAAREATRGLIPSAMPAQMAAAACDRTPSIWTYIGPNGMMRVKPEKMNAAETVTASWLRFQGSCGIRFRRAKVTRTEVWAAMSESVGKETSARVHVETTRSHPCVMKGEADTRSMGANDA